MRRILLAGRTGAGKTTLTQALQGERQHYRKTQTVECIGALIDTPGEYTETKRLGYALALWAYEADLVGLLCAANEPFSLFPPCCTCMVNREVIGIVTKTDAPNARPERAAAWLRLAGCKKIFAVSARTGEGMEQLSAYLQGEAAETKQKTT